MARNITAALAAALFVHQGAAVAGTEGEVQTQNISDAKISVDDIVVTARKRRETLQSVPLSVTAVNAALMERNDIRRIDQVGAVTPNVLMKPNGSTGQNLSIYIRGIGTRVSEPSQDNPIVVSVDGVYLSGQAGTLVDLFDVQQVEVLRGPQGTLQGRNSPGGAVNITTQRPTNEFEGRVEASYLRFNQRIFRGVVNVPLIDGVLAVRFGATYDHGGDFMTNLLTGKKTQGASNSQGARLGVLFTPNDDVTAYLTMDYSDRDPSQSPARAVPHRGSLPREPEPGICTRFGYCSPAGGGYDSNANFNDPNFGRDYGAALNLDIATGFGTITSVSGYRHNFEIVNFDNDGVPIANLEIVDRTILQSAFSQEIRLASNPGRFTYIVGALATHSRFSLVQPTRTSATTPLRIAARSQQSESYALFGQLGYKITGRWSVTLGGRQTFDQKELFAEPLVPGDRDLFKARFDNFSYEIGSEFRITPTKLAYVRHSTGYRAGGINGSASSLAAINIYNPEKVAAYEAGLKTEWLDNRFILNLAGFYYRYKDLQLTANAPFIGGFTTRIVNARGLITKGIEVEATARPTDRFTIKGSVGYLDAKYRKEMLDLGNNLGPLDISTLMKENAPKWTAYVGADYRIPLSDTVGSVTLSADMNYQSTTPTSTIPSAVSVQSGYALVNGSITYRDADERYSLALFGRNLTNKYYILTGSTVGSTAIYQSPGRPRTYGVRATARF